MAYTINSELGDSIYKNLGQNETYSAKDGSTWYRDDGGNLMVKDKYGSVSQAQNIYQAPQASSPSTYNIGSALGNNYYKSLGQNDTYTAKDGSYWYRDQSGQLMVKNAAGNTMAAQNNYTYANEPNTYSIGSELGYEVYKSLPVGVPKTGFSDGSTWVKQPDGSVIVTTKDGQQKLGVLTYDPAGTAYAQYAQSASSGGGASGSYVGGYSANGGSGAGNAASTPTSATQNVVGSNPQGTAPTEGTEAPNAPQASGYGQYGIPQAQDQSQFIKDSYGANLEATKAGLEQNYNKSLSAIDAEESGLGQNYYELQRQAQAQSDLQKNAYNEYANANGLNNGTRGQAALSQSNNLATQMNNIRVSEAEKRAELERQRTLLGQQYQSAIQQAQAQNDMQLAQALYDEAVRVDKSIIDAAKRDADVALQMFGVANENQQKAAAAMASAGDYSAYGSLYGVNSNSTLANQIKGAVSRLGKAGGFIGGGGSSYSGGGSSSGGSSSSASTASDGTDYAQIYSDFMNSGEASLKEFILDNYKNYGINGSNRYAAANNVQAFVDGGGMQTVKNSSGGYDYKAGNGYDSLLNPQAASGTSYTSSGTNATAGGTTLVQGGAGGNKYISDAEAERMLASGEAVVVGATANGNAIINVSRTVRK